MHIFQTWMERGLIGKERITTNGRNSGSEPDVKRKVEKGKPIKYWMGNFLGKKESCFGHHLYKGRRGRGMRLK